MSAAPQPEGELARPHEQSLEELFAHLLAHQATISIAESCTGGLVSATFLDMSGASACYNEGYVTYANEAKMRLLGVSKETLENYGAVSSACAKEMAEGVKSAALATYGISTTGIAGPTGGTPEKPVGTVYIGCAGPHFSEAFHHVFEGDRTCVRQQATAAAFSHMMDCITKYESCES